MDSSDKFWKERNDDVMMTSQTILLSPLTPSSFFPFFLIPNQLMTKIRRKNCMCQQKVHRMAHGFLVQKPPPRLYQSKCHVKRKSHQIVEREKRSELFFQKKWSGIFSTTLD